MQVHAEWVNGQMPTPASPAEERFRERNCRHATKEDPFALNGVTPRTPFDKLRASPILDTGQTGA